MDNARPTPISPPRPPRSAPRALSLALAWLGPLLSGCVHHPPLTSYSACDAAAAVDADPPECRRCLDRGGWFDFRESTLLIPGAWSCGQFVSRYQPDRCGLIAKPSAQAECRACVSRGENWAVATGRLCQ
jgi:hypothetical protein